MAQQFRDKVVVVTGSSSGIGQAVALMFASLGAKVTFTGRRPEKLKASLNQAVQLSGRDASNFLSVEGDVTKSSVRQEIVQQTVQAFGRLDVLVLNAGVTGEPSPFSTFSEQSYDMVLDTNLKSTFFMIQQALPYLEAVKGNVIINSSISSTLASPHGIPYSLTKAALDHLTRCLAVDLGPKGIRVNSVNPGYLRTSLYRDFGDGFHNYAEAIERSLQPLKGRVGTLTDVVEAVAFLASEAAGFVTGVHLKVDGGRALTGHTDVSKVSS